MYSSHRLPCAGAAPLRSQRLRHQGLEPAVRINGTARHAAWNRARPHARGCARVCRLRPRSGAASQPTATRGPSRVALAPGETSLESLPPETLAVWAPTPTQSAATSHPKRSDGRVSRPARWAPRQNGSVPLLRPQAIFVPLHPHAGALQARFPPTPRPHGALSARWGGATLGRGVVTVLDARTRSQPLGYVSGHVTPTRESPVKQQDV
ncbi:uncharacterized protein Gm46608 [Mus musculus]|uniref:uncharacterized protein Gm46608 n=1 Tax=Mus musculus TaxID=10090 RepID=UPI0011AE2201|nr:uncharacterized protein Gm46608 [Mus musculus]